MGFSLFVLVLAQSTDISYRVIHLLSLIILKTEPPQLRGSLELFTSFFPAISVETLLIY